MKIVKKDGLVIEMNDEELKEEQEDKQQSKNIRKHIERVNHCPYCDAVFCGSLKQMEEDRINHIKKKHPEKRPFKIEGK